LNAYRREHYRRYREQYIQRNARVSKERGHQWSRRLWDFLLAHACVDCGETNPIVLEFDHLDSTTKLGHVGSLARAGYSWSTVLAELEKCEVRCANCHRKADRPAVWLAQARDRPGRKRWGACHGQF
jgi:hypothetical protein